MLYEILFAFSFPTPRSVASYLKQNLVNFTTFHTYSRGFKQMKESSVLATNLIITLFLQAMGS
jgi:hypothetical protein